MIYGIVNERKYSNHPFGLIGSKRLNTKRKPPHSTITITYCRRIIASGLSSSNSLFRDKTKDAITHSPNMISVLELLVPVPPIIFTTAPDTETIVKDMYGDDEYLNSSIETYGKGYTMKNAVKIKAVDIAMGYAKVQ